MNNNSFIIEQLIFTQPNGYYPATFALYKTEGAPNSKVFNLLHTNEVDKVNGIKSDKRKASYLLGRISAKLALSKHLNIEKCESFYIDNGIFNQPIAKGLINGHCQLSLSHTNSIGVAVASEEGFPMGVDIEHIDSKNCTYVLTILTINESLLLNGNNPLLLWTAKEALAKCLKTGFTIPFEWFQINQIINLSYGLYEFHFQHFNQFKSIVLITRDNILALAFHSHSQIDIRILENLKLKMNEL